MSEWLWRAFPLFPLYIFLAWWGLGVLISIIGWIWFEFFWSPEPPVGSPNSRYCQDSYWMWPCRSEFYAQYGGERRFDSAKCHFAGEAAYIYGYEDGGGLPHQSGVCAR